MKKKILFLIIFAFLFSTFVFGEEGFRSVKREDLKLDEALSVESSVNYSRPQKILVAQVGPSHEYLLNDTKTWLRLFHYYNATRLNLPDIPFNYIVDRSGNIYEGLENAEGRAPYIDSEDGVVLIAYFSNSADITLPAQKAFQNLIENYSYKFGIEKIRVEPIDVFLENDDSVLLSQKASEGLFRVMFLEMIQKFEYSKESNLRFSGKVEDLKHEESVTSGEELKVEFVLKNTDSFPWYIDEGFLFLSTGDGEESPFAINQVWESFSKPLSLEPQVVLPGGEVEITFELDTEGVLPGKYESSFKFVMLPDINVVGSELEIDFEVEKGDRKVVQIRPTGTGALTVYSCPEYTCEMVAAAVSGERYLVIEEKERWYKISVDGVEGWVTIHYATPVD